MYPMHTGKLYVKHKITKYCRFRVTCNKIYYVGDLQIIFHWISKDLVMAKYIIPIPTHANIWLFVTILGSLLC